MYTVTFATALFLSARRSKKAFNQYFSGAKFQFVSSGRTYVHTNFHRKFWRFSRNLTLRRKSFKTTSIQMPFLLQA